MNTEQILDDLFGISYGTPGTYSVGRLYKVHDDDFADFTEFPLIVIEDGDEASEPRANRMVQITYMPKVHLYVENQSSETVTTWRENIRNAIYGDATLRGHCNSVLIAGIECSEPETRKLQHVVFTLELPFDYDYN
jgi:hypothetical protein